MSEVDEAVEQCQDILDTIDEIDRTSEFLDDVKTKVGAVCKTIEKTGRVTEKQQKALDSWQEAVNKFKERD